MEIVSKNPSNLVAGTLIVVIVALIYVIIKLKKGKPPQRPITVKDESISPTKGKDIDDFSEIIIAKLKDTCERESQCLPLAEEKQQRIMNDAFGSDGILNKCVPIDKFIEKNNYKSAQPNEVEEWLQIAEKVALVVSSGISLNEKTQEQLKNSILMQESAIKEASEKYENRKGQYPNYKGTQLNLVIILYKEKLKKHKAKEHDFIESSTKLASRLQEEKLKNKERKNRANS